MIDFGPLNDVTEKVALNESAKQKLKVKLTINITDQLFM